MMQLNDRIELLGPDDVPIKVLRAHVGMSKVTQVNRLQDGGFELEPETLRAIVLPDPQIVIGRRYRWRGDIYVSNEHPLVRRRGARDNHFTVKLERIDAP